MVKTQSNEFQVGLIVSVFLHGLLAYTIFFGILGKSLNLGEPVVYSITLEGGKSLGGISQAPQSDKKMPVAPPRVEATGKKEKSAEEDKDKAEVSLADKETKEKAERERLEREKAEAEKKKAADKKKAEEAKKAAEKAKQQSAAELERQYQKAMQRYLGESSDAGGKGFGAAKLGGSGMGGGVLRPPEFFQYRDLLKNHIKRGWNWYDQNSPLTALVSFEIAPDGSISEVRLAQGSGDREYDDSVIRAVLKASPAPPPPAKVYEFFKEVRIEFKPGE